MSEERYVELFAGAGGMSLGLEAGGFAPMAHAEIEPHARAVLRQHWPDVRLDGDVAQINGADYAGVTLLSGGSPCQDFSVAGKRAGLVGARSSLFHEQARIWHESGAPYLLWENVGGALSSNQGRDFATVLSALVGSPVTVPRDGWRGGGGVVAGRDAVAAWRVLDLQHFGPPQRRVRVFVLAARTGGVDPAEILALGESMCGHPAPRAQSRESVTGIISARTHGDGGLGTDDGMGVMAIAENQRGEVRTMEILGTLSRGGGKPRSGYPCVVGLDIAPTLCARDAKGPGNFRNGSLHATVFPQSRPRRLMPVECERLQGWPDGWTARGVREDGTEYALSDTARYRLIGNGVGSPCAAWIARRLAWAIRQQEGAA